MENIFYKGMLYLCLDLFSVLTSRCILRRFWRCTLHS